MSKMEHPSPEGAQEPKSFIPKFALLVFSINTVGNVLGWGTLISVILHIPVVELTLPLLFFFVPVAVLLNLVFIVTAMVDTLKAQDSLGRAIKDSPWKTPLFIWGYASSILFYIGSALFLYYMWQLFTYKGDLD